MKSEEPISFLPTCVSVGPQRKRWRFLVRDYLESQLKFEFRPVDIQVVKNRIFAVIAAHLRGGRYTRDQSLRIAVTSDRNHGVGQGGE